MIQIVWRKKNAQELQTNVLELITQKRGVVWMEKKIWKSLFGEKHLFGKLVHVSVKNTANNADTWGFIQQFFQYLYRTAYSVVHRVVWVKTAQIHRYR